MSDQMPCVADSGVIDACIQLCNEESELLMESGARALRHLAWHGTAWADQIVKSGGVEALVHVCATATTDSSLGAAACALDYCAGAGDATAMLGADTAAIAALARCW